jgi:hypothetical protein
LLMGRPPHGNFSVRVRLRATTKSNCWRWVHGDGVGGSQKYFAEGYGGS